MNLQCYFILYLNIYDYFDSNSLEYNSIPCRIYAEFFYPMTLLLLCNSIIGVKSDYLILETTIFRHSPRSIVPETNNTTMSNKNHIYFSFSQKKYKLSVLTLNIHLT
jgi:hypothetical protein